MTITAKFFTEAAVARGWKVEWLDEERGFFMLHIPDDSPIIIRNGVTELSTGVGSQVSTLKNVGQKLAEKEGFHVADTTVVEIDDSFDAAENLLEKYGRLVVKPIDAAYGDGVSVNVRTKEELNQAIEYARKFNVKFTGVIVQEFCKGKDYRMLVLNDKVIAAIQRSPLTLTGDGSSTIEELIEKTLETLLQKEDNLIKPFNVQKNDIIELVKDRPLSDILADGEKYVTEGAANLSRGGLAIDVTDVVNPEVAALAIRYAKAIHLPYCAVDVLTEDIALPLSAQVPTFLEANVAPGFRGHYFPSVGAKRDVANMILDAILAKRQDEKTLQNLKNSV